MRLVTRARTLRRLRLGPWYRPPPNKEQIIQDLYDPIGRPGLAATARESSLKLRQRRQKGRVVTKAKPTTGARFHDAWAIVARR